MITPSEIATINAELAAFRARLDAAKEAAGWGVGDWLFDAFYFGWIHGDSGTPRADVRDAVLGGDKLYDLLVAKRNEIIEAPDEMHEEALDLVLIARRAAKWDRAATLEGFREATAAGPVIGDGIKASLDAGMVVARFVPALVLVAGVVAAAYLVSKVKG